MDIPQGILVGVIALLTLALLFIGWQVFFLILDIRRTIKRTNKIVDDIGVGITTEILKIAFSSRKERHDQQKVMQKESKQQVKLPEPTLHTNGNGNGDGGFPQFFKGLPKRR